METKGRGYKKNVNTEGRKRSRQHRAANNPEMHTIRKDEKIFFSSRFCKKIQKIAPWTAIFILRKIITQVPMSPPTFISKKNPTVYDIILCPIKSFTASIQKMNYFLLPVNQTEGNSQGMYPLFCPINHLYSCCSIHQNKRYAIVAVHFLSHYHLWLRS